MKHETIRVIIVDDHKLVRETWKMLLETHDDIDVIQECASGTEAIDIAAGLDPDVILMDINMAPVNGLEATRQILQNAPHIKIIGVSINDQPGYARSMLQLGAKGYVTKNSSREEMIKAIQEVVKGNIYVCSEVAKKMGS